MKTICMFSGFVLTHSTVLGTEKVYLIRRSRGSGSGAYLAMMMQGVADVPNIHEHCLGVNRI